MEQSDIVKLLQIYGFTGLTLLTYDPSTSTSNYKFEDCNTSKLKGLGASTVTANGKVAVYTVGATGKLGYCPSKNMVRFIFKGKARGNTQSFDTMKTGRIPTTPEIEQAFYKAQANSGQQRAYVKKVWVWANQHFFSSKMGLPEIFVSPECPFNSKLSRAYGVFSYSPAWKAGKMFINSKCFNATEQITTSTIIHEMCHQATYEIDRISIAQGKVEEGHGPEWKKWMVHCNLEPNRYAYEDLAEYGDSLDLIQREEKLSQIIGPLVKPLSFKGLKEVKSPEHMQVLLFDYRGHLARGLFSGSKECVYVLDKFGKVSTTLSMNLLRDTKFYLAPSQDQDIT